MGDESDYLAERDSHLEVEHWVREDAIANDYWVQRDGSLIHVSKMADSHIANSINMMTRKIDIYIEQDTWDHKSQLLDMLKAEQRKRRNKLVIIDECHLSMKAENSKKCQQCGKNHDRKKFCSNRCKDRWHNTHNPRGYGLN